MITEIVQTYPIPLLVIIAAILTLVSTLVTKWLTNQEHLKSLKNRQKEIQKELKSCKPGECKFQELQEETLKIAGTMMKSQFKPMFVTIIPFLLVFYWIRSIYTPLMGFGWFWWYLGASIVSNIIYRKLFKMA